MNDMDAIALLKKQHRQVSNWFDELETLAPQEAERQEAIFLQIADALAAHTKVEEQIFYPAVLDEEDHDELEDSLEEHLAAKRVIAELLDCTPGSDAFMGKIYILRALVEDHVDEEEANLFPHVQRTFSAERREELGEDMQSLFEELMRHEPHREIPAAAHEVPHFGP